MTAEADLLALERALLTTGNIGAWLTDVDAIRKMLVMGTGDPRAAILAMGKLKIEADALATTHKAYVLGLDDANALVNDPAIALASGRGMTNSSAAIDNIVGLDRKGATALAKAQKLATLGQTIEAAAAPLIGHANTVRATITHAVVQSRNEASAKVATLAGLPTVWISETTACVNCLAYSGQVVSPGDSFPDGLTFGASPLKTPTLKHPPLHPHCRCTIEPLLDPSFAEALRREAERSVLRGFSLESESMRVRVDAADRLLKRGVTAPKSVIAYSERSVKAGKFATRDRPHDPTPPTPPQPRKPPPGKPAPKAPKAPKMPPTTTVAPAPPMTAAERRRAKIAANESRLGRVIDAPIALAKDRKVPLSETIKTAKTPTEAAAMLRLRHPELKVLGFDAPKIDLKQATDALGRLSDLLDRFPKLKLDAVEAMAIRNAGVFAQVRTPRNGISSTTQGSATFGVPRMEISLGKLRNPKTQIAQAAHAHEGGHFHDLGDFDAPMLYTVTHEFGHVLDANLQFGGRAIVNGAKADELKRLGIKAVGREGSAWAKANISGYGLSSGGEHVAEAFANYETSGLQSTPLSQVIHARLLDAYRKLP